MDPEAFLQQQQEQNASGRSFQPDGVSQQHQHQQQSHDTWQSSSIALADGAPSVSSANQYQIPSPSSPSDVYYLAGQPQHQQQHPQSSAQQDAYTPTRATLNTRPSTGLSLNIASLSVESATPSPLTGGPSPFTMHAPAHLPMYVPSISQHPGQQHQAYGQNDAVFTFAAPSPKPEWQDHHPIGRSQSSSALFHGVNMTNPPHYTSANALPAKYSPTLVVHVLYT